MIRVLFLIAALALFASPAFADPVSTAVAGWISTALGGSAVATAIGSFVGRWLVGTAFSVLGTMLNRKEDQQGRGIQTSVTLSGGTNPQSFVLGRYATAGVYVCPPLSHSTGSMPNEYLTTVIDLGDIPGQTLAKLYVNGEEAEIGAGPPGEYGLPVVGDYSGRLWVKYYDGSQTVADPMLLARYGADPDFPWSADMIGVGKPYAILTAKFDQDFWTGLPSFRFEVLGIPLYDLRKDSSIGGSGSHREADASTWEQTENLVNLIDAVMRGIELPSGDIWGGQATNLPVAVWAAALNECDVAVARAGGGTEPQFRGGIEVTVDTEPKDVVEALLRGCMGQIADVGGAWHIQVGAPPLPVYFFTDRDIVVSEAQELDPFPGLESTINGVTAKHPSPASAWEFTDAPPHYNPDLEDKDSNRRLLSDLTIEVCPYDLQIQRLQRALVNDHRRFIRHALTLPPDAIALNPLDTIAWTSERNGYEAKLFEVTATDKSLTTLLNQVGLRERDPSDYDWSTSYELPVYAPQLGRTSPDPLVLPGFGVTPIIVDGDAGRGRLPGIQMVWTQISATTISWEVRLKATAQLVASGVTPAVEVGHAIITQGLRGATEYQVRALINLTGLTAWTGWHDVTTDDVRITLDELSDEVFDAIGDAAEARVDKVKNSIVGPQLHSAEELAEKSVLAMLDEYREDRRGDDALVVAVQDLNAAIDAEGVARAAAITELAAQSGGSIATLTATLDVVAGQGNAHAASLATLFATTGNQTVTLAQHSTAIAGLGGSIQFSLDVNGHIAGFGLYSEIAAGGTPDSAFVVLADVFQISSGSNSSSTPFVVYTQPTTIDGVQIPAGAYLQDAFIRDAMISSAKIKDAAIDSAKIKNAAIEAAHIKDAEIDTIKVKNGAITNKFAAFTGGNIGLNSYFTQIQQMDIDCDGNPISILANIGLNGATSIEFDIRVDGASQRKFNASAGIFVSPVPTTVFFSASATGIVSASGSGFGSSNNGLVNVSVNTTASVSLPVNGSTVVSITVLPVFYENMITLAMVANPAAGNRNISLHARVNGGHSSSPAVRNIFLETTENKR